MAAHRYWRVYITATNGATNPVVQIAELQMRETAGGADAIPDQTSDTNPLAVSVSSRWSSTFAAWKAMDDSIGANSLWVCQSGASLPQWIKVDFGAGNEKDIVEITLQAFSSGGDDVSPMPRDFEVEWSDDNSAWTSAHSVTGSTGWSDAEVRTFTFAAPSSGGADKFFQLL